VSRSDNSAARVPGQALLDGDRVPQQPASYTIVFSGTSWDTVHGRCLRQRLRRRPGRHTGTDGGDFASLFRQVLPPGTYQIRSPGVGHQAGAKSHAEQIITVPSLPPATPHRRRSAPRCRPTAPPCRPQQHLHHQLQRGDRLHYGDHHPPSTISPAVTWTRTSCSAASGCSPQRPAQIPDAGVAVTV